TQNTQCILDGGCCTGWGSQGCGGGGCWNGERRDERWCGGSPQTDCTTDGGCEWNGNWGPFLVAAHGQWASNGVNLGTAPNGFQNYTITWQTVGHRHGGSNFWCSGSFGGIGIGGFGGGATLGPEFGGWHSPQTTFPC